MKLYNTLSNTTEKVQPSKGNTIRMYNCGPTVYDYAHIGNWRAFLFADFLRRALEYEDYEVKQVMNLTDVGHLTDEADQGEDKVEKKAREEKKTAREIADFYIEAFLKDMDTLNMERPHKLPKATDHIEEMIELVKDLEEAGYTYEISDGIYFDTSEFEDYGKLSGQDPEERMAGARVCENKEKRNPTDFALWKFSPKDKQRQMEWESPWGTGFPGWHIECSTLSTKYLGQPFDIHTGGVDHIGVHHENEIAQSEAATGDEMAYIWMHVEHMGIEGEKMSKSKGNFITVTELEEKGYDPLAFRLLVFSTHYRKKQNFRMQALDQAQSNLEKIYETVRRLQGISGSGRDDFSIKEDIEDIFDDAKKDFSQSLKNDLNTPQAFSIVMKLMGDINTLADEEKLSPQAANRALTVLFKMDELLGLKIKPNSNGHTRVKTQKIKIKTPKPEVISMSYPEDTPEKIKKLAQKREELRKKEEYKKADEIRKKIKEKGYKIKDTDQGPILEKI